MPFAAAAVALPAFSRRASAVAVLPGLPAPFFRRRQWLRR
jgi:hypothetical protein